MVQCVERPTRRNSVLSRVYLVIQAKRDRQGFAGTMDVGRLPEDFESQVVGDVLGVGKLGESCKKAGCIAVGMIWKPDLKEKNVIYDTAVEQRTFLNNCRILFVKYKR